MANLVTSQLECRDAHEPLYEIDALTGDTVEIFYGDPVLAKSFGARGAGWFWWSCRRGSLPDCLPTGPFPTSFAAYRDTPASLKSPVSFGKRPCTTLLIRAPK